MEKYVVDAHYYVCDDGACCRKIDQPTPKLVDEALPEVLKIIYQPRTTAVPLDICKKDKRGNIMTTIQQYIGVPFLVHFLKTAGAWPSMAKPCNVRIAQ